MATNQLSWMCRRVKTLETKVKKNGGHENPPLPSMLSFCRAATTIFRKQFCRTTLFALPRLADRWRRSSEASTLGIIAGWESPADVVIPGVKAP